MANMARDVLFKPGSDMVEYSTRDFWWVDGEVYEALKEAERKARDVEFSARRYLYEPHGAALMSHLFADAEVKETLLRKIPEMGEKMAERVREHVREEAASLAASVEPVHD